MNYHWQAVFLSLAIMVVFSPFILMFGDWMSKYVDEVFVDAFCMFMTMFFLITLYEMISDWMEKER